MPQPSQENREIVINANESFYETMQLLLEIAEGKRNIETWNDFVSKAGKTNATFLLTALESKDKKLEEVKEGVKNLQICDAHEVELKVKLSDVLSLFD